MNHFPQASRQRPLASLSLDLDNKWSYLKTHGNRDWESLPSYLPLVIPRILDVLQSYKWAITFFVVGLDAEQPENRAALQQIDPNLHELANHSYRHEPWLHRYTRDQVEAEITRTETAIRELWGVRPIGFRGPGFTYSRDVLEILAERGYQYDGSTFPTFLGPAARFYYFLRSSFDRQQKKERQDLFGAWTDGFQRLSPYTWKLPNHNLLEIPVTTIPLLRAPFHLSYVMYLAQFSELAAVNYFANALRLCRWRGVQPSILLHPLDFLGSDDEPQLSFFPGMSLTHEKKSRVLRRVFDLLQSQFQVVTMAQHAAHSCSQKLPHRPAPRLA